MSSPLLWLRRRNPSALWAPTDESDLLFWFDPTDTANLTLVGSPLKIKKMFDLSGNGNHAVDDGSPSHYPLWEQDGIADGVWNAHSDGVDDYLYIAANPGLPSAAFTFVGVVMLRSDNSEGYNTFIANRSADGSGGNTSTNWQLYFNTGTEALSEYSGDAEQHSPWTPDLDTPYVVAMRGDPSTTELLYDDGTGFVSAALFNHKIGTLDVTRRIHLFSNLMASVVGGVGAEASAVNAGIWLGYNDLKNDTVLEAASAFVRAPYGF